MNLENYIVDQLNWSRRTFGHDQRTEGTIAHIRKELREIEDNPDDIYEWVDVIILAIEGAHRRGYSAGEIVDALCEKQARNFARTWPDWRTAPTDQPIEHVEDPADGC